MADECKACSAGRNCINGRYCTYLRRYVQHMKEPPCVAKE